MMRGRLLHGLKKTGGFPAPLKVGLVCPDNDFLKPGGLIAHILRCDEFSMGQDGCGCPALA
jgi:hypothetical protein